MNNKLIIFAALLFFFTCMNIQAQSVSLDLSFDTDGKITTNFGGDDFAKSTAIQSDGKIVVTGYVFSGSDYRLTVIRYNTDGSLDNAFGLGGKVMTAIGTIGNTQHLEASVAIQSDGKIVVAGSARNVDDYIAIVRCNTDGSLDNTFDTDGIVTTVLENLNHAYSHANSVAIQNDGKIVVVGECLNSNSTFSTIIIRYNTDGSLDNTFDTDGIVKAFTGGSYNYATSVKIQNDEKMVVIGSKRSANEDLFVMRYNTNGSLDSTFDADGIAIYDLGYYDIFRSMAIQSDGKIVVAGFSAIPSTNFVIIRYNTDGSLDNTFDTDGKVTTTIKDNSYAYSIKIQSDGKIIVAGDASDIGSKMEFAITRYNTDGSLDNTFDTDGIVTTPYNTNIFAKEVAIQNNSKIIVVGTKDPENGDTDIIIGFYNMSGSLDNTIDSDGIVITNFGLSNDISASMAIQNDGKIVGVGTSQSGLLNGNSHKGFAVMRYNTDGSLDDSFSSDGKAFNYHFQDYPNSSSYRDNPIAHSVTIQSDNKIIVGGKMDVHIINFPVNFTNCVLMRYNTNGSLDSTFGLNGFATYSVGSFCEAYSTVLQSDGKILLVGVSNGDFLLIRYNTDGTLDNTFGTNGKVTTSIGNSTDIAHDVVLQNDGKILVAGLTHNGSDYDFAIVRYNTDGSLDNTFGTNGKVTTSIGNGSDMAHSVVLQSDGKILVAGQSHNGSNNDFAIARYNTDGSLDITFDIDGKAITTVGNGEDISRSMTLQSDGKILVAGQSNNGSNSDFSIVRYNTDGSLDNTFGSNGKFTTDFNGNDIGYAVALQSDDKIVVAGQSNNDFAVLRYNNTTIAIEKIASEEWILNTYPNPTKESVTVEIDNRLLGSKYLIVNQLGQIMLTGKFVSEKTDIDIQDLAQGVYYLQIAGKSEGVVKIIKE